MKKGDGAMNKSDRVLILLYRLLMGERVRKHSFMEEFAVGRRSFDRYIASVRLMLSEVFAPHELCYDAVNNEYYLTGVKQAEFRGVHILPLVLLLFESKALNVGDTLEILKRLLAVLPQKEQQIVGGAIREEGMKYEPAVTNSLLKLIWDLNFVISRKQSIRLWYDEDVLKSCIVLPKKLSYANSQLVLEALKREEGCCINCTYPLGGIRSFEVINK